MLEYVVLGDFQTAVGFLLASTPEKSARYYRDALCTLALAVRPWHCTAWQRSFGMAIMYHISGREALHCDCA